MSNWLFFFLPACGLVFLVSGTFMLFVAVALARTRISDSATVPSEIVPSEIVPSEIVPSEIEAAAKMQKLRSDLALRSGLTWTRRIDQASGPFWLLVGLATLWFSELKAPWILPIVGLSWTCFGAWATVATFRRRGRQTDDTADDEVVSAIVADPMTPRSKRRIVLQQGVWGMLFLCLGIPLFWLSAPRIGATPLVVPPAENDDSDLASIVRGLVERDFARQGHVGMMVGVVLGNEEVLLGFGARGLGDRNPPDADTPFEIGSITKVFTGILLAQQIEKGELELDDRVADLLPEGWELSEAAREITLRHCTTHASGLPRLPENHMSFSRAIRSLFRGDPYRDYSEQAFRDALATTQVEFEPGTRSLYSNFAMGLLGFVLATHGKTDYEALVTSQICRPLGMHDTFISRPDIAGRTRRVPCPWRMTRCSCREAHRRGFRSWHPSAATFPRQSPAARSPRPAPSAVRSESDGDLETESSARDRQASSLPSSASAGQVARCDEAEAERFERHLERSRDRSSADHKR